MYKAYHVRPAMFSSPGLGETANFRESGPGLSDLFEAQAEQLEHFRHSSRPWAGRLTDIRIECSAVYTLRCLFMARITSISEVGPAQARWAVDIPGGRYSFRPVAGDIRIECSADACLFDHLHIIHLAK